MDGSVFEAACVRSDAASSLPRHRFVEPSTIGLTFLVVDAAWFALSGLLLAFRAELLVAGAATSMEAGLALCLGTALFCALCRAIDAHDGLKMIRRPTVVQLLIVLATTVGPVAGVYFICSALSLQITWQGEPLLAWLLAWGIAGGGGALALHAIAHPMLRRWRRTALTGHRVAIVGSGEPAQRLVEWLQANAADIVQVVGVFDDRRGREPDRVGLSHLIRGTTQDLVDYYRQAPLDKIIIALPHHAEERLLNVLQRLKQLPVDISLAPDLVGFRVPQSSADAEMAGLQMMSLAQRPLRASQRFIKDIFDRAIAAVLLVLMGPLLIGIALAVKLTSPGPVFFRQERYGLGNRSIRVLKFRSMRTDMQDLGGARQAQRNDPRVTPLGAFLRRTSLDELPQLINVLKGDMSLVGPRPLPVQMRVQDRLNYEIVAEYSFRHRVKPGITGWAQVKGHRGAVETAEGLQSRVTCDLYYIDHWSLWLDLKILLLTGAVCAFGKNAF
ncbi:MAG TPA: undecaprenyl-phosphate glucose phosphotransferase [Dongiaceae bacterium]|jgi:Undecaprenyl-phosphate glucose phosphotransferase